MIITAATNAREWDGLINSQKSRPFLQSWTMGEVYARLGQDPIRLLIKDDDETVKGVCLAHVVPAKRGRHLSIPYGPILGTGTWHDIGIRLIELTKTLKCIARDYDCSFIRMSPFWTRSEEHFTLLNSIDAKPSPLHLLAEHLWLLPLENATEEELMMNMRSTTRNLIRRAQKEGVTVEASSDPVRDLPLFLKLHDETRKRHKFTPYTNAFFRAQVEEFAKNGNVILYVARHQGEVLATSIHMTFGGETSYHHGASVMSKIPASYLLQWTAITDALKRGDHLYNFWGIAPMGPDPEKTVNVKHPFAGVTLFKTGFGGKLLELTHCVDLPITKKYWLTRAFELVRKWRRGF